MKTIKFSGFADGILKFIMLQIIFWVMITLIDGEVTEVEESISTLITLTFAFITSLKIEIED